MLDLHAIILKLLISLFGSKLSSHFESHISLDWKFHTLLTYTPRFAHAVLQSLGFRGDSRLEQRMFFPFRLYFQQVQC